MSDDAADIVNLDDDGEESHEPETTFVDGINMTSSIVIKELDEDRAAIFKADYDLDLDKDYAPKIPTPIQGEFRDFRWIQCTEEMHYSYGEYSTFKRIHIDVSNPQHDHIPLGYMYQSDRNGMEGGSSLESYIDALQEKGDLYSDSIRYGKKKWLEYFNKAHPKAGIVNSPSLDSKPGHHSQINAFRDRLSRCTTQSSLVQYGRKISLSHSSVTLASGRPTVREQFRDELRVVELPFECNDSFNDLTDVLAEDQLNFKVAAAYIEKVQKLDISLKDVSEMEEKAVHFGNIIKGLGGSDYYKSMDQIVSEWKAKVLMENLAIDHNQVKSNFIRAGDQATQRMFEPPDNCLEQLALLAQACVDAYTEVEWVYSSEKRQAVMELGLTKCFDQHDYVVHHRSKYDLILAHGFIDGAPIGQVLHEITTSQPYAGILSQVSQFSQSFGQLIDKLFELGKDGFSNLKVSGGIMNPVVEELREPYTNLIAAYAKIFSVSRSLSSFSPHSAINYFAAQLYYRSKSYSHQRLYAGAVPKIVKVSAATLFSLASCRITPRDSYLVKNRSELMARLPAIEVNPEERLRSMYRSSLSYDLCSAMSNMDDIEDTFEAYKVAVAFCCLHCTSQPPINCQYNKSDADHVFEYMQSLRTSVFDFLFDSGEFNAVDLPKISIVRDKTKPLGEWLTIPTNVTVSNEILANDCSTLEIRRTFGPLSYTVGRYHNVKYVEGDDFSAEPEYSKVYRLGTCTKSFVRLMDSLASVDLSKSDNYERALALSDRWICSHPPGYKVIPGWSRKPLAVEELPKEHIGKTHVHGIEIKVATSLYGVPEDLPVFSATGGYFCSFRRRGLLSGYGSGELNFYERNDDGYAAISSVAFTTEKGAAATLTTEEVLPKYSARISLIPCFPMQSGMEIRVMEDGRNEIVKYSKDLNDAGGVEAQEFDADKVKAAVSGVAVRSIEMVDITTYGFARTTEIDCQHFVHPKIVVVPSLVLVSKKG